MAFWLLGFAADLGGLVGGVVPPHGHPLTLTLALSHQGRGGRSRMGCCGGEVGEWFGLPCPGYPLLAELRLLAPPSSFCHAVAVVAFRGTFPPRAGETLHRVSPL